MLSIQFSPVYFPGFKSLALKQKKVQTLDFCGFSVCWNKPEFFGGLKKPGIENPRFPVHFKPARVSNSISPNNI